MTIQRMHHVGILRGPEGIIELAQQIG